MSYESKGANTDPRSDKVIKCYNFSKEAFEDARQGSEKSVRYINNESWSSSETAAATKHGKPALKYNIIIPILSTLQGNEQLNRRRASFKPTTIPSVDIANIVQGRWNAINDEENLEEKIQIAFIDALSTRVGGWIERTFEINSEGYLDFCYRVVNNMRVFVDPETRASDFRLKNCRWIIKEGWETLDVIKSEYGLKPEDYKNEQRVNWWNQLIKTFQRFKDEIYSSDTENYDKENDRYKVLEMQERVTQKVYRVFDGEAYYNLEPKEFAEAAKETPQIQKIAELDEDRIHVTVIIPFFEDAVLIDADMPSKIATFTLFPVFSYNYNIQVSEQTSLVDLLIDVQDDINKGKSQVRDYVTQILSGGVYIDKREKEAIKQLKQKGNQPGQVYELLNPANPPQKMPMGNVPPDIMLNAENSYNYAQRVSLITEAMRGESARSGESGVLFQRKVQRAAAAINPYFHNISKLRKALAEDFIDNFAYVYAEDDRVINIKQTKNIYQEVIVNLNMAGKVINEVSNPSVFVELDEGEDNITQKEDDFNSMLALINIIAGINPQLVDIESLVANAPIQGADKMVEYIQQVKESQAGAAEQQRQIDTTKGVLDNLKTERDMVTAQEKLKLESEKVKAAGAAKA